MLQNNVEMDLKMRMLEDSTTQTELAEKLRVSVSYVNRITKGREQLVNKTFIAMMEQLGYDVRLVYEKRGGEL
jgi:plasmid maintenance system antidote protein VapI